MTTPNPAKACAGRSGLPSVMSLEAHAQAPFCRRSSSPVQEAGRVDTACRCCRCVYDPLDVVCGVVTCLVPYVN